jgi:hypothetical protein
MPVDKRPASIRACGIDVESLRRILVPLEVRPQSPIQKSDILWSEFRLTAQVFLDLPGKSQAHAIAQDMARPSVGIFQGRLVRYCEKLAETVHRLRQIAAQILVPDVKHRDMRE